MKFFLLLTLLFSLFTLTCFGQQTKVYGKVYDAKTKTPLDFAKISFKDSDISVFTDEDGSYVIETYYATDTLIVSNFGYKTFRQKIQLDKAQEVNIYLEISSEELDEVVIKMTGDSPAMRILKRVIRNKHINNKEKLETYEYELYNKIQVDLNNIGEKFEGRNFVKKIDFILNYLDSTDREGKTLPVLLSESVSDFYFKNNPPKKKEVMKASRISGIDNLQINQVLGDVYMDINVYDNYIDLFQRAFVSPISDYGKSFYNYSLADSAYIDDHFYFKIDFKPKRSGETTFEGSMWIHDTTYAVKEIKASLSSIANINYINGFYIEQYFDQVQKEVWMMMDEKIVIDLKITRNTKLYGLYLRKTSSRNKFNINEQRPDEFYKSNHTVETLEGANERSDHYWDSIRHTPLSIKEEGINTMVDSLNRTPFFNTMKNIVILASTGYYPFKKVEFGNLYSIISINPVERFRTSLSLRTSNNFSKRIELGGMIGYGFYDRKIKGGAQIRINVTPKKRGMLTLFANSDLEQYGSGSSVGNTFATFLRSSPLDKLFYVNKAGFTFEKDISKDFIFTAGIETKQLYSMGNARFERLSSINQIENVHQIKTTEIKCNISWGKERQFISGVFDRALLGSRFPILTIESTFGIKGILGSQFNYNRIEFRLDHTRNTGILGRIRYGFTVGQYFGQTAYPFLNIHTGSQTYWFLTNAFNKMHYFEFISDRYVSAYVEHHFQGLIFDRIPGIKKLKWRLVVHGRATWGALSDKHNSILMIPSYTKDFGKILYAEFGVGIENIFKFFRVDLVYRATHHIPGTNPFGVRVRWDIII